MKLLLFALILCVSLVHCLRLPNREMTNIEIGNYVLEHYDDSQGDIVYPLLGDTWYIGEKVNVTFKADMVDQSVAIFFFNKTETLVDGVLNQTNYVFDFTVPKEAYSGSSSTSLLLAVRRQNRYLQSVDSVVVHVL